MPLTGRYHVRTPSGRTFTIEPISPRDTKIDGHVFKNGGIGGDSVKNKQLGGSIRSDDSIITEENGYKNICLLPRGYSPESFIEQLELCTSVEEEDGLIAKYNTIFNESDYDSW